MMDQKLFMDFQRAHVAIGKALERDRDGYKPHVHDLRNALGGELNKGMGAVDWKAVIQHLLQLIQVLADGPQPPEEPVPGRTSVPGPNPNATS